MRVLLAALLPLRALAGGGTETNREKTQMIKVFLVGDSISVQYYPYLKEAAGPRMEIITRKGMAEAMANLDIPAGSNSGDSGSALRFLERAFGSGLLKADILLMNCGLHDIKTDPKTGRRMVSFDDYEANLNRVAGLAERNGTRLVWVLTTPCDEKIHNTRISEFHRFAADAVRCNEIAKKVFAARGMPVIDLFTLTSSQPEPLYCDHVHFTEPVRKAQGEFIASQLSLIADKGAVKTSSPKQ